MDVPNEVQKCVCFVGYAAEGKINDGYEIAGTAFVVSRKNNENVSRNCVVTAKHVIAGIAHLRRFQVYLRVNTRRGQAIWISTNVSDWIPHHKASVDLSVLPFVPEVDEPLDQRMFPADKVATAEILRSRNVGVGDEVFFPGLFWHHHGRSKNVPIVRSGTIAALSEEAIILNGQEVDAYLIEARSIGGLSGSPVFVNLGGFRKDTIADAEFAILGVVRGHFEDMLREDLSDAARKAEAVNMGIALVTPVEYVLETLDSQDVAERVAAADDMTTGGLTHIETSFSSSLDQAGQEPIPLLSASASMMFPDAQRRLGLGDTSAIRLVVAVTNAGRGPARNVVVSLEDFNGGQNADAFDNIGPGMLIRRAYYCPQYSAGSAPVGSVPERIGIAYDGIGWIGGKFELERDSGSHPPTWFKRSDVTPRRA